MDWSRALSRPFLPAIGALAAAYCLLALLLAAADPLALYPWGVPPRLKTDGDYSMQSTPYLVDVVAKDPSFDTLLLGGSTGHFYTPRMLEEMLPNTRRAFNLSYGGPSASDRAAVARQLSRYSHARHLILEVDWTYTIPTRDQHMWASFPIYLYDDKWWNDVRDVDLQTIKLSLAGLRGQPLWISSWGKTREQEAFRRRYELIHSAATMAEYSATIARRRVGIDAPSKLTCDAMDEIGNGLVPFVRTFSQRGAQVDLLIPPYSWMIYYRAGEPGDPINRPTLLNDMLMMRTCLVQALDGIPRVHIFAFDDQPEITGDFRNYFDAGHLYNPEVNRHILHSIATGEHRLTSDNIDAKNSEMRSNVIHYRLTGGKIGVADQ
jgi:hypothetical protein